MRALTGVYAALTICIASIAATDGAIAQKRVALVIGNSAYVNAPRLDNPANDAADVAGTLRKLNFDVTQSLDLDKASMDRTIRNFADSTYQGADELNEHPLAQLIARPNAAQCGPDFLEAWYGFLLVAGNAYIEAVATGGEIRELHALRPDRIKVVPGSDGWPEAWEYSVAGRSVRLAGEVAPGVRPVLHMKLFHPTNDHYGMSPLEAAASAIDVHNAASRWNKALLDNSARPSGALVYAARDGNLSPSRSSASRPSWSVASRAPSTPAGRCCSKAGSTGSP